MPLQQGSSEKVKANNFDEFRHGPTFAKTQAKFGQKKALKQMEAVVLSNARKSNLAAQGGRQFFKKSMKG